ncbi:MAG TPA: DUF5317 domain-containing protein [Anaerolineaceae bacterium]|nr:DUF5317 domain-containing protein [Anaerolineaceae bacterium]
MILLLAVFAGLIAGGARAIIFRRELQVPSIRLVWLAAAAFIPQAFVFSLPTRYRFTPEIASGILIVTQFLLLLFVLLNGRLPGFWLLGLGLAMNMLVIGLNRGLMPISPETITRRSDAVPPSAYTVGERLGYGKDVVLRPEDTRLEILADRFVTPSWFPEHFAFSLGDIVLALGMIWFLWSLGGPPVDAIKHTPPGG